jgi:hypothetical protein
MAAEHADSALTTASAAHGEAFSGFSNFKNDFSCGAMSFRASVYWAKFFRGQRAFSALE